MVLWRWALLGVDAMAAAAAMAAVVLLRPVSGWWVWGLAALLGLPLMARRYRPVPVLTVTLLTTGTCLIVGVGTEVVVYAVAYALYPVALSAARPAAWGLGALATVLVPGLVDALTAGLPVVAARTDAESFSTAPLTVAAYSTLVVAGSAALARAVRTRQEHATELARLRTARAVAEERLRIARDVHDIVGHNLSLIAMKAAVAGHLGTEPQAALRSIEQVSRSALHDVRTVLNGLREPHGPDTGGFPGVDDLDRLVTQTRAAGVTVTLDHADLSGVPAGVRTSTYRILQEALTNVRRHGDATHCQVTLAVTADAVHVAVIDNGHPPHRADPPGHGLLGMRERAALHHGSLSAGPEPDGGYAVRATLPLPT